MFVFVCVCVCVCVIVFYVCEDRERKQIDILCDVIKRA